MSKKTKEQAPRLSVQNHNQCKIMNEASERNHYNINKNMS